MKKNEDTISVIVPFYRGNQYLKRLLTSIDMSARNINSIIEVVFVNDSPDESIKLPETIFKNVNIVIYNNIINLGIHKTRCKGLTLSSGNWIVFLDQDDELVADGFSTQIVMANAADIVVGNGLYQCGTKRTKIFKNKQTMNYLIQKERFVEIRNLIPSPGECLIRKDAIPEVWIQQPLNNNGADDWFLWLLLFSEKRKFTCNDKLVYVHNETDGGNLSYDLDKMKKSCDEMLEKLKILHSLSPQETKKLERAINFKYLQDTKKIQSFDWLYYIDVVMRNSIYKIHIKES